MPETEPTYTDGRGNVRPKLQCLSHFFLEIDDSEDFEVVEEDSFGATSATKFRTTTKFTFPEETKEVYALCQGTVFLQPGGESGLVNLVLKPFVQPVNELPIKYIIYRGLKKSDFIEGDLIADEETGTDFIKKIWKEFNQLYGANGLDEETPPFSAAYIGYPTPANPQTNLSVLLDSFFYKVSGTTVDEISGEPEEDAAKGYELPMAMRGMHIGYAEDEIGIDIVLNNGDYYVEDDINPFQLDLSYARSADFVLDTEELGSTPFEKKLVKESCTQFIDVVAFYGLHANGAGKVFVDNNTEELTDKEDIYDLIKDCHTKHTQYLYIDSDRQRSYNFYGNYQKFEPENIKTGTTMENLTEEEFGGSFGWHVHLLTDNKKNIQLLTDNNPETVLFTQIGEMTTENETHFVRGENILPDDIDEEETLHYTQPIGFHFEHIEINSEEENIASIVKVIYEGARLSFIEELDEEGEGTDIFKQLKDIDDIFGLIAEQSFLEPESPIAFPSIQSDKIHLINFPNKLNSYDVGAVKTKRTEDAIITSEENYETRVTYESLLSEISQKNAPFVTISSVNKDFSSSSALNFDIAQNNYYSPQSPYFLMPSKFSVEEDIINGFTLKDENGGNPTKKMLGLTSAENENYKNFILLNSLSNVKFYFSPYFENDGFVISPENVEFKMYHLKLVGETQEGELNIFDLPDLVLVFTIDEISFFSMAYCENMIFEDIEPSSTILDEVIP